MPDTLVTVVLSAPWIHDKRYESGSIVTIPKDLYESTVARFPGFMVPAEKGKGDGSKD